MARPHKGNRDPGVVLGQEVEVAEGLPGGRVGDVVRAGRVWWFGAMKGALRTCVLT